MLMINDLLRHNKEIMSELLLEITAVMESGWYVIGNQVKEFEIEFASYCHTEYCVSVANGTDALELALRALGIERGDKILTVANAGGYSTTAILAIEAIPVYLEIDDNNLLLSVEHLRELISNETRAIVVTHLYGQVAPVDIVMNIAEKYGIPVIEDCAQAHSATLKGRKVGSFGALGCFSFYPTKNLGGLGDGGAITTNDSMLAERVKMLRQYGWKNKYEISLMGGRNSRLDELQAAVLRVKLRHLDQWNERRNHISQQYMKNISHPLITQLCIELDNYVGHLFVLRSLQRDKLHVHLNHSEIMSEVHYPIPDYHQSGIASLFPNFSLPVTERVCGEVLTLPCFPEMVDTEVNSVIEAVNGWSES